MCEPAQSIVQYNISNNENDSLITGDKENLIRKALGNGFRFGKRFLDWLHFSKMGEGHSGISQSVVSNQLSEFGRVELILPKETKYETLWWDRVVRIDGPYRSGQDFEKQDAILASKQYAQASCLGNMSIFRRFLEESMKSSSRYKHYVTRFLENVLNKNGRSLLWPIIRPNMSNKDFVIAKVLGATRKRNLFQPHWADEEKIW